MEELIRLEIEDKYKIKVNSIEKIKGSYRINGENGYGLKVIKYNYPHFLFIISAIIHLEKRDFLNTPSIIKTNRGENFINIGKNYAYLTKWLEESRVSNFEDLNELEKIGEAIGNLHEKSRGFVVQEKSEPRLYWGKWPQVFKTRKKEIFDFKKRINQKAYKNEFDKLFLYNFDKQIKIADRAILRLEKSFYREKMIKDAMKSGFCHHDLANHNILISKNGIINFIDFDYCILDSNLHDVASILWRANKLGLYNKEKGKKILEGYQRVIKLDKKDEEIIKAFLMFPNDFWQIGLQMYWEQQPWGEEFMINKLNRYLESERDKLRLIEEISI